MEPTDLASIVSDIDADHQIKGERVLFLRGLLPKQDEAKAILQYKGEDKCLTQPELFFRTLLVVPRVNAKVKVIETIELFQQNSDEIISSLRLLTITCKNVMRSEKLKTNSKKYQRQLNSKGHSRNNMFHIFLAPFSFILIIYL